MNDTGLYRCGMVSSWHPASENERRAFNAIADFDGWPEELMIWQVKAMAQSITEEFEKPSPSGGVEL